MHNKTGEVLFQVKQAESDADRCVSYASPVSIPPQEGPDGYVNHKLLVPSASRRPDDAWLMLKGFGQHDMTCFIEVQIIWCWKWQGHSQGVQRSMFWNVLTIACF